MMIDMLPGSGGRGLILLAFRLPKNCPNCGAEVHYGTWYTCPKCGAKLIDSPSPKDSPPSQPQKSPVGKKSPWLAAVLSFIFPGLGQLYNKQIPKGIGLVLISLLSSMFIVVLSPLGISLVGYLLYVILWLYGMYDAYHTSEKINTIQKGL
jgi:TM2 domain-containing membrane protein YozV